MQRRCLITAGAITQRLDKLQAAGLVRRDRDRADRRVIHVTLTPRGRRLVDQLFAALMEQEQRLLEPFASEERALLATLLRRWLVTLEGRQQGSQ